MTEKRHKWWKFLIFIIIIICPLSAYIYGVVKSAEYIIFMIQGNRFLELEP